VAVTKLQCAALEKQGIWEEPRYLSGASDASLHNITALHFTLIDCAEDWNYESLLMHFSKSIPQKARMGVKLGL
jgi:hypothetical protein